MNWLILVIIATVLDSTRIFVDNYSSDVYFKGRGAVSQKLFYGYTTAATGLIILAINHFDFLSAGLPTILLILLSGVFSAIGGIPYYKALEIDDSTNIGIFTQLAPVLYLILGWFFLNETFSPFQLVAFAIIVSAPFLIVFTTKKRSRKIKLKAVFYAFLYVFIAVIGNLIFVKTDSISDLNFFNEMALLFISRGVTNTLIVYTRPKWHHRFRTVVKQSHGRVFRPLCSNFVIGLVKDFTYRGGLVSAPAVALASAASDSVEPIIIFFMGLLLTLIWPRFGREKLDKKTVTVHLIATILVVVGIVLLQI